MSKFIRYEGDSSSKLRQMMSRAGSKPSGVRIELATVIESPPNLKIRRDSDQLVLEKEELVVAEHLAKHKRIMTFQKVGDTRFSSGYSRPFTTNIRIGSDEVSEEMTPAGLGPHTHDITVVELANVQNDFDAVDVEVEYQDELRKDDRVLLACDDDNMVYYVLDRAVFY